MPFSSSAAAVISDVDRVTRAADLSTVEDLQTLVAGPAIPNEKSEASLEILVLKAVQQQ